MSQLSHHCPFLTCPEFCESYSQHQRFEVRFLGEFGVRFGFLESLEVQCSVLEHACRLGMNLKVPNLKLSRTLGLGFKTDCWTNELLKKSNWISNFRFILHSGPENLKKYRPKKLVKKNLFHEKTFFYQNPFFANSKMAKNQFLNWKKV